jgi:hypothetical protein
MSRGKGQTQTNGGTMEVKGDVLILNTMREGVKMWINTEISPTIALCNKDSSVAHTILERSEAAELAKVLKEFAETARIAALEPKRCEHSAFAAWKRTSEWKHCPLCGEKLR